MDDIKIRLALDGADQVQAGANKAADAMGKLGASTGKAGQQAQLSGYQLAQVSAQLQDLFIQIQGGQAPLTAILQQGSQLSAVFGGVGNAFRAVASLVSPTVVTFGALAAAVGGVTLAYTQGVAETNAYTRAVVTSGNAAGVTVGQLRAMAAAQAAVIGTQADAADALAAMVQTGQVASTVLKDAAEAAVAWARVGVPIEETSKKFAALGKDPLKAVIALNESENFLTEAVYKQIKALEEQGRTREAAALAQTTYADVTKQRAKEIEQGLGTLQKAWKGVADFASQAWDKMLNVGRPASLQSQLQDVQAQIQAAQQKIIDTQSSQAKVNRPFLDVERIVAGQQRLIATLNAQAETLAENIRLEGSLAQTQAERAAGVKTLIKADEDAAKAAKGLNAEREREAAALERAVGLSGSYQKDLAELVKLREKGRLTEEQYVAAVQKLITTQPVIREQLESQAKAMKAVQDLQERQVDQLGRETDAVNARAAALEASNAALGKSASAAEAATLAELRRQAADLEATDNVNPKYLAGLYDRIRAQERLVDVQKAADAKQLNSGLDEWLRSAREASALYADEARLAGLTRVEREKVAATRQTELRLAKELARIDAADIDEAEKDAARIKARQAAEIEASNAVNKVIRDDFTRSADYIEQSLTDALMRGGKSGAEYLEDLFRTMVLKLVIQAVVQTVPGQLSSTLGSILGVGSPGAGGAGLGGGTASQILSLLGMPGLGSAFTGGFGLTMSGAGGTGLALQGAGGLFGNGAYGQAFGQATGALAPWVLGAAAGIYGGRAISNGFAIGGGSGNTAVNVGTAIGAVIGGPIGAAIGGAIGGLANRAFGRGPREVQSAGVTGTLGGGDFSGQMYEDWRRKGGWFRSDKSGTDYSAIDSELEAGLDLGARALLENTKAWAAALALPGEQLASVITTFRTQLSGNAEQDQQAIASILQGYSDALTVGFVSQLAPFKAGTETTNQTLERLATSLVGVNSVLGVLGQSLLAVSASGGNAASQLLDQFGGLQQYQAAGAQYLQDYYSEAERTALATQQLTTQLAGVGLALPASRDAFRDLVEAQDLNTEAGRAAYAELLKLSPAFAALVPAMQETGSAIDGTAAALQKAAEAGRRALAELAQDEAALQVELLRAQGDLVGAAQLARQQALARITEGLSAQDAAAATAAYTFNDALREQIAALNAATAASQQAAQAEAQRAAAVASERDGIQARIDDLLGNTSALRARELAGLDESNRALLQRYFALLDERDAAAQAAQATQEAAEAAQRLADRQAAIAAQGDSIQARIDELLGNVTAQRARELAGLDEANRALQERYYALLDERDAAAQAAQASQAAAEAAQRLADRQAAIAAQGESIQARIDDLLGNVTAQRARELAGLDEANRALQQRYYALLDERAATQAAAQASQELARQQAAVASQRDSIQQRIDQLLGNTVALRERELAGLDESNRALQQHYFGLLDAKAAQDAANQAAQQAAQVAAEQARAAEQLRDAWRSISDTLVEEAQRILGMDVSGTQSLAQARAQFAITTGQARAGDQEAARLLPQLGRTLIDLVGDSATSRAELDRIRAQVAASLQGTAGVLGGLYGFTPKSGGPAVDVRALLRDIAATAPIVNVGAAQLQASAQQQSDVAALVAEVKLLIAKVESLVEPTKDAAAAAKATSDLLIRVTENGEHMLTKEDA